MRRAALLALLLLPLVAAGPNAREDPLSAQADITGIAVSWDGRAVAASSLDPAGTSTGGGLTSPDAPAWYIWEADGSQIWASHADRVNCGTLFEDDCVSDTVGVSLSDDGSKFAVASLVEAASVPSSDPARGLVVLGTGSQGVVARFKSAWPVDLVHVSGDGSRVIVVSHDPAATVTKSRLQVLLWPAPNLADPVVETEVADRIQVLSASRDGKEVALGGDSYWHLSPGSTSLETTTAETNSATSVHVTRGGAWSVVGYAKGTVGLYEKTGLGVAKAPVFSRQPGSADITSVAATADGTWYAAGDAQGRIHFFEIHNPTGGVPARYVLSVPVSSSAVRDLHFSQDGAYAAYRTGGEVHFARWDGKVLTNIWKDERVATALTMDATGDLLAVAVENDVILYDALHFVVGVAPVTPAEPGITATVKVTYRNDGNRAEEVTLVSGAPKGWTVAPATSQFRLEAGATKVVDVRVQVPDGTAAGTHNVRINHTLGSGGKGFTMMDLEVPLVERLILESVGSPSVSIDPGSETVFPLKLRNAGNGARNVALTIDVPGPSWQATVDPEAAVLGPGESLAVMARLQAPSGLADGDGATVTVSVDGDPAHVNLTATAGAFFEFSMTAPGGVEGALGNGTTFEVGIRNTGNAPDTIQLSSGPVALGWAVLFENGHDEFDLIDIQPGETRTTVVTIAIGEEAEVGTRHAVDLIAESRAKPSATKTKTVLVTVGEPVGDLCDAGYTYTDGECVKERGVPAVGVPALLAVLALALVRRR